MHPSWPLSSHNTLSFLTRLQVLVMALSTAQARGLLDRVSSCLVAIKTKANSDHAGVQACLNDLDDHLRPLKCGLASPHSTWQQLLRHKVRQHRPAGRCAGCARTVGAVCCVLHVPEASS